MAALRRPFRLAIVIPLVLAACGDLLGHPRPAPGRSSGGPEGANEPSSAPPTTQGPVPGGGPARMGKGQPGDAPTSEFAHMSDVGVFAAGRCEFSNCMKNGWSTSYRDGQRMRAQCNFSDCLKNGWSTTVEPSGKRFDTHCEFSDCLKNGWTTELPKGNVRTRCEFSNCMKNGWTSEGGEGRVRTQCNFSDCMKNGWTTTFEGKGRVSCTCNFSDCLKNGAECRE